MHAYIHIERGEEGEKEIGEKALVSTPSDMSVRVTGRLPFMEKGRGTIPRVWDPVLSRKGKRRRPGSVPLPHLCFPIF